MAARLVVLLPRLGIAVLVCLLAAAAATFAAGQTIARSPSHKRAAAVHLPPASLVVPDVRRQAYVFAKETLEDDGFAWRVAGPVQGYAANLVVAQQPGAGSRLVDTGAPTIVLRLARNPRYPEHGTPENLSTYAGTALQLVGVPARRSTPSAKPERPVPRAKHTVEPRAVEPAPRKPKSRPSTAEKPAAKKPVVHRYPQHRPPAFVARAARREPLDEMPLPERARKLGGWLASHPRPTSGNVHYWLYQHAWIVQGARFGWWHGAEALRILIADDRRAESMWGIGARSGALARAALAEVERKSQ